MIPMNQRELHRTQAPIQAPEFFSFVAPFSSFEFIEKSFVKASQSINRCFSLARSKKCVSFSLERINSIGILESENEAIRKAGWYTAPSIYRVAFYRIPVASIEDVAKCIEGDVVGYAIIKADGCDATSLRSYVFESVFLKYEHPHNCVNRPGEYSFAVGEIPLKIRGVLYCQQNGCNKACAHVALRSLISRHVPGHDVEYSELNDIASSVYPQETYDPANGLDAAQIEAILSAFDLKADGVDYLRDGAHEESFMRDFPYRKFLYSGVESGVGGLLGFNCGGDSRHIIPVFGHTFNKDTWASDAESAYFQVGSGLCYMPSDLWTSSFIAHDDNFGSDFCIPRLYVEPKQVDYVAGIFPKEIRLSGGDAEAIAIGLLPDLVKEMDLNNPWQKRLAEAFLLTTSYGARPQIVLRSLLISKDEYFARLKNVKDWALNSERPDILEFFAELSWPRRFWMVEVSLQQLFPANEAKLGEFLLDAMRSVDLEDQPPGISSFLFARLPGAYFFRDGDSASSGFFRINSRLCSHVELRK